MISHTRARALTHHRGLPAQSDLVAVRQFANDESHVCGT